MTLEQIVEIEPEIGRILSRLQPSKSTKARQWQYIAAKNKLSWLVGSNARRRKLRDPDAYVTVTKAAAKQLRI